MTPITYQKIDNYYVFSHNPKLRVYMNASPEDYIEDYLNQQKRNASSWYREIHTGKKVTWDEIMGHKDDGSKPGNGLIWYGEPMHEFDKREDYTYEGGFTFEFKRKVSGLHAIGNYQRSAEYEPQYKSEAWAYVSGKTLQEQRAIEESVRKRLEEFDRDHPWLINLHNNLGYVDDDGKPITLKQQQAMVKARYGDDVFDKAHEKMMSNVDPKILKIAEKLANKALKTE